MTACPEIENGSENSAICNKVRLSRSKAFHVVSPAKSFNHGASNSGRALGVTLYQMM